MGGDYNSGKVQATISTTGGINMDIPAGATRVNYAGAGINTGVTIWTTTAGKTFYVMGFFMQNPTVASYIQLDNDGTAMFRASMGATSIPYTPTIVQGTVPLFTVAATKALVITHTAGAGNPYVYLWGYEN